MSTITSGGAVGAIAREWATALVSFGFVQRQEDGVFLLHMDVFARDAG